MATGFTPPMASLSVETGTPPAKWSESVFASSSVRDTPATFSEAPARTCNPEKKSQEEHQASKMLKSQQASHSLTKKDREEPHISLPSTELKGAQPLEHTSGVGALPGNLSESSVALLPDERQERAEELRSASPRQRRDTIKPSAAADETRESMMESQTQIPRDVTLSEGKPVASKLSDVPLQGTEAGVAEAGEGDAAATGPRVRSRKETSETQVGEQQTAAAIAAAAQDQDTGGASKPDQEQSALQDVQRGEEAEPAGTAKEGYGGDYHPAVLHPPPPGASAAEYQSPVVARQEAQDTPATGTSHHVTEGAEKKSGFMTMVKGEMKIIAGKVRGDEHKVAEGRKLVRGEA